MGLIMFCFIFLPFLALVYSLISLYGSEPTQGINRELDICIGMFSVICLGIIFGLIQGTVGITVFVNLLVAELI